VLFRRDDEGVYRELPRAKPGAFERLRGFRCSLLRCLPPTTHVALEEYPSLLVGRKRIVAQRAVDSLLVRPVEKQDAKLSIFVKCEKVDQTSKGDSAPRVISPRTPRYCVSLGTYLKCSEKALYLGIARVLGSVTVAKGLNMLERGNLVAQKWGKFSDPVAVGLDASRFDQHFGVDALKFEHSVYNSWHNSPELRRLLRWQLVNTCEYNSDEGKVAYEVRGCRMSGDMNTSSGNCLVMCAMVSTYGQQRDVRTELINDGDDCVVFMERRDLLRWMDGLQEWFLELGFNMKVEDPVSEIEKVVFCQANPIHIGGGEYIMVRNPKMSISKDSVILKPNLTHVDGLSAWMWAVGDAMSAACGGIPVLGEFYQMYRRNGKQVAKLDFLGEMWWYNTISKGMAQRRGLPVKPETRLSFYIAFGILPDEQVVIEDHFRRTTVPSRHPQRPTVNTLGNSNLSETIAKIILDAEEQN
jgi:hypothetical protein